jgi:hypothetical protein
MFTPRLQSSLLLLPSAPLLPTLLLREFSSQQQEKQLPYDNHSIRHDVSLNKRATNVQLNVGPRDSGGPQLLTRDFDYKLNTRDAFDSLNARYLGDDPHSAHEPYEGGYESGSEPEAPGASLLHGDPVAHPQTKTYQVAKALKTAGQKAKAAGKKAVKAVKGLWRPKEPINTYTKVHATSEEPDGGASDNSLNAKRAESGNWKRDLAHSLGLDTNSFL